MIGHINLISKKHNKYVELSRKIFSKYSHNKRYIYIYYYIYYSFSHMIFILLFLRLICLSLFPYVFYIVLHVFPNLFSSAHLPFFFFFFFFCCFGFYCYVNSFILCFNCCFLFRWMSFSPPLLLLLHYHLIKLRKIINKTLCQLYIYKKKKITAIIYIPFLSYCLFVWVLLYFLRDNIMYGSYFLIFSCFCYCLFSYLFFSSLLFLCLVLPI